MRKRVVLALLLGMLVPALVAGISTRDRWGTYSTWEDDVVVNAWAFTNDDEAANAGCDDPENVQLNSQPHVGVMDCADDDDSTAYFNFYLPSKFVGPTVLVDLEAVAYASSGDFVGDLDGDIRCMCRASDESVGDNWGSAVTLDITAFDVQWDQITGTSASITPGGTCTGDETLYCEYQVDAVGTDDAIDFRLTQARVRFNRRWL